MFPIKMNVQVCWFHQEDGRDSPKRKMEGADAERAWVTLEDGDSGNAAGVTGGWIPFDREGLR
jgi:hypothetical protein